MADTFETYRGVVYPWEIDQIGHMNVQFYTAKFDQATWHFLFSLGITPAYLREENRGMVAVQQNTSYKRELHAGDLIVIRSQILDFSDKTIRFLHRMEAIESGTEAATTELTGVHLDSVARKSCPLPDSVQTAAREMLAAGG